MDGDQTPPALAATAAAAITTLSYLTNRPPGESPESRLGVKDIFGVVRQLADAALYLPMAIAPLPGHLDHLNGGTTHLESDLQDVSVGALLETIDRSLRDARATAHELEDQLNEAWKAIINLHLVQDDAPAT